MLIVALWGCPKQALTPQVALPEPVAEVPAPEPPPQPQLSEAELEMFAQDFAAWHARVEELDDELSSISVGDERDFAALVELAGNLWHRDQQSDACFEDQAEVDERSLLALVCPRGGRPAPRAGYPAWRELAASTDSPLDDAFLAMTEAAGYDPVDDSDTELVMDCLPLGSGKVAAAYEATLPLTTASTPLFRRVAEKIRGDMTWPMSFPQSWCEADDKAREAEALRILRQPLSEEEYDKVSFVIVDGPKRTPLPAPAPADKTVPALLSDFLTSYGTVECALTEEEFSQSCAEDACWDQIYSCQEECGATCGTCQDDCLAETVSSCEEQEDPISCQAESLSSLAECRTGCRDAYPDCYYGCEQRDYSCGEPEEYEEYE